MHYLTADYADLHRLLRREQADATPPGACKNVGRMAPGLCDGYAPHTLRMCILRMRENTIHTCGITNASDNSFKKHLCESA